MTLLSANGLRWQASRTALSIAAQLQNRTHLCNAWHMRLQMSAWTSCLGSRIGGNQTDRGRDTRESREDWGGCCAWPGYRYEERESKNDHRGDLDFDGNTYYIEAKLSL